MHQNRHYPALIACLLGLMFACALFWPNSARAAQPTCAATTVSAMNFGTPSLVSGGSVDTTATLTISCSSLDNSTRTYCLSLEGGAGGTSGTDRIMTGTGGNVRYNIYQDAARTIRWGSRYNTALGGVPNITIPGASTITYTTTIYGRIISGQSNVTPGNYSSLFSGTQVEFSRLDKNESDCITSPIDPKTPTASPSFTVSVAPIADCTISVGALSFGTQGVLAQNVDASSTLAVTCTNNTPFTVGMGNGLTGTSPTARKMTLGANSVIYAVYQNSSRTTIWSNASTVGGTGNGSAVTLNVYGRVPSQTTPVAGNYSDSVVVTVTF